MGKIQAMFQEFSVKLPDMAKKILPTVNKYDRGYGADLLFIAKLLNKSKEEIEEIIEEDIKEKLNDQSPELDYID